MFITFSTGSKALGFLNTLTIREDTAGEYHFWGLKKFDRYSDIINENWVSNQNHTLKHSKNISQQHFENLLFAEPAFIIIIIYYYY